MPRNFYENIAKKIAQTRTGLSPAEKAIKGPGSRYLNGRKGNPVGKLPTSLGRLGRSRRTKRSLLP